LLAMRGPDATDAAGRHARSGTGRRVLGPCRGRPARAPVRSS